MERYDYKISIIVPVYNCEHYLPQCIDSIQQQTFSDFELILVDDGSTDGSAEVCGRYVCDNVRLISQANRGVSAARNRGLESAEGEYVLFVDSDDWLSPTALDVLMSQPEKADITFFGSLFRHSDSVSRAYIPDAAFCRSAADIQDALVNLLYNPRYPDYVGFTWNKLFRNDIIRKHNIRFIEGLAIREDEAFAYQYVCHCSTLATLPDLLYNYRVRQTGLTFSHKTAAEYIKLGQAYEASLANYANKSLCDYFSNNAGYYYFLAMRRSEDTVMLSQAISLFRSVRHAYRPQIRFHGMYKLIVWLDSLAVMKAYFCLRMAFKALRKRCR